MYKKSFKFLMCLAIIFTSHSFGAPANFSKAKKIARKVFSEHKKTIYCNYDKYNKVNLKVIQIIIF